jgi:hypothetical protein
MDHSNKACNASGGTKSISDSLSVSLRAWNHFVHNTETAGHFVQKLIVQEPGGYVRVAAMVCVISYGEGLARGCLEMCRTTVHHQLGTLPINPPPEAPDLSKANCHQPTSHPCPKRLPVSFQASCWLTELCHGSMHTPGTTSMRCAELLPMYQACLFVLGGLPASDYSHDDADITMYALIQWGC